MKKRYEQPVLRVFRIAQAQMICISGNKMAPGQKNALAGSRSFDDQCFDWDEEK